MSSAHHLLKVLKENPFVLAPMAGITDHAFRSFMKEQGASVVISELVSATGLEYKSARTEALMSFDPCQHPVGIQIFGENPEHLAHAAKVIEQSGADFVDINFGCPVPKVVKKGAGSAMLKDLPALTEVLRSTVKAVKIPVTIKIRTGWDSTTRNAHEVVKIAANEGIAWVAIHGRTRAQGYEGLSDWEYIGEVKAKSALPILGNGDIVSAQQAVVRLRHYALDGIMIGRGALKNPFIFLEAMELWSELWSGQAPQPEAGKDFMSEFRRDYVQAFRRLQEVIEARCNDHITQIQLKKFAVWFSAGYPGAAQFRKEIFQAQSVSEIMETATLFLHTKTQCHKDAPSNEGFLMGGHG